MSSTFTDFNLDSNSYVAFDATSLRDLILQRLKDQGVFTDQVFEGSNLSSMIDIIAYSYHVLLYYLNKTSSESMFSDAVIYENMNRIVKLLNYKPIGYRTSIVTFQSTANNDLPVGSYTIPRYSFVDVDGIFYTLKEDIAFSKYNTGSVQLTTDDSKYLLYQGKYQEYPSYTAVGNDFETVTLALDKGILVDHQSIDVYVYSSTTGKYSQWKETQSLYLQSPADQSYEIRLNENYRYEIRFGNDISGARLNPGDVVCIYYIKSDGGSGIIGSNRLKDKKFTLYTTNKFVNIKNDIKDEMTSYLTLSNISTIELDNDTTSTDPQTYETVGEIRSNAPAYFSHQNRLITSSDFTQYVKTSFSHIVNDAIAVDNTTYISQHIKYLVKDLSLDRPLLESRLLSNQVSFANSTTFNNVYIYVVPRVLAKSSINKQSNFLSIAQKELIKNSFEDIKGIGLEPVFIDPVYMAVDFCATSGPDNLTPDMASTTRLHIIKSINTPRDKEQLKHEVSNVILQYFKHTNMTLGQTVNVVQLYNDIVSIPGVQNIKTVRGDIEVTGVSILVWNPVYNNDIAVYNQNITLPYFKYPYLYDSENIVSRIDVIDQ